MGAAAGGPPLIQGGVRGSVGRYFRGGIDLARYHDITDPARGLRVLKSLPQPAMVVERTLRSKGQTMPVVASLRQRQEKTTTGVHTSALDSAAIVSIRISLVSTVLEQC